MKILHLTTFLQGGAGRIVVDLATVQRQTGHEVAVVASRTGTIGYGNSAGYLETLGRRGVLVRLVDSTFVPDYAANLNVLRALEEMFPAGVDPGIIHTHAATPSLIALLFAGVRRRPVALVQTLHGWGANKTPMQAATDVAVLNRVDRVAVPSRHAGDLLTSLGVTAERITVVPYGVGDERIDLDGRDEITLHEMIRAKRRGALVVACIGTIGARKNQRLLIDAVALLAGTLLVHCVIIGDGETAQLEQAIEAAGLQGQVRLHGYSRAARRLAAGADVMVLPSRSEGQPLVVLESFSDGTLVAVSDIPELAELVEDGETGLRFDGGDAAALAAALVRVSTMPNSLRWAIRRRARALHAERFTVPAMAQNYFELYRRLVRPSARASLRQGPRASPAA